MSAPVLELDGVSRRYGAFYALADVSVTVEDGAVVGLIGENGAGKSTLLNLLSGVGAPSDGEMRLHGAPYAPRSYAAAMEAGVVRVYQEPALIATLSLRENFILGLERHFTRFGWLARRRVRAAVDEALAPLEGLVDPDEPAGSYGAGILQTVEILRAVFAARTLGHERPVILLDEPTAALSGPQVELLFETIERLRGRASFVFVSHRLQEIQQLADYSYVLKDGAVVARVGSGTPPERLHALMVGREQADDVYGQSRQRETFGEVVLELEDVSADGFEHVSLRLHAGEILSLTGVIGSGKDEVARFLGGDVRRSGGTLRIGGRAQRRDAPIERAIAGVAYIPHDRLREGIIGSFSVARNISLSSLARAPIGRGPLVRPAAELAVAERWIERLSIRTRSAEMPISALSGGNQQKAVIARGLQSGARVLVLDNPTRGVDAGAKLEIYAIVRELAAEGLAVVVVSDDLPEAIGLGNRVLVLKDGRVVDDVAAPAEDKPDEVTVIRAGV